jgi:sugar lactone lactonase YvrE
VVLFSDLTGFKLTADIAIDSSGNGWLSDAGATAPAGLYKISPAGAETALSGGGLNAPNGLAVDGAGLIFTGNSASTSGGAIAIYNSATSAFLTGATGLTGSYVTEGTTEYVLTSMGTSAEPATGLAVDGSGDLWVANGSSQDLTEILGVATPVLTPLSAQIVVGKTASKP